MKRRMSSILLVVVMLATVFAVAVPMNLSVAESGEGLVAYWKFDEGTGDTAYDSSGNNNNGTLMPNYPTNAPQWVDGIKGKALQFDGVDDYVKVPDDDSLDITDAYTISAWFKINTFDVSYSQTIIAHGESWDTDKMQYSLSVSKHGALESWYESSNDDDYSLTTSDHTVVVGRWYHGVVVLTSDSQYRLYLDGIEKCNSSVSAKPASISHFVTIGVRTNTPSHPWFEGFFNGTIDEVRIWNRALSEAEIWENYISNLPDLSITSDDITFSNPNPTVGDTITIDATVRNIGYINNEWIKYSGNPVLELGPSGSWDDTRVCEPTVIKVDSIYNMWYSGWDGSYLSGECDQKIGYATSSDGINWIKHGIVLDLGSSGDFDELALRTPWVIYDEGIYKMWYHGYDSYHNNRIGYATSPDGISWTKYSGNPILELGSSGTWDDYHVNSPSVIKEDGTYKMWYSGYDGSIYRVGYATSSDGVTWIKHPGNPVLGPDPSGSWDDYATGFPSVIKDGGLYKLLYTGQTVSDSDIGYATSSDGINWNKHGIAIEGSNSGWDIDIWTVSNIVIDGNYYKVWYTGNDGNPSILRIGYAYLNVYNLGYSNNWVEYMGNPLSSDLPMTNPATIYNGSAYQMWYHNYPEGKNMCYATSNDGITWAPHPNNPLFGNNDVTHPSVIFDGSIYKMWYTKQVGLHDVINYATSPDGIEWTQYPGNPVLDLGDPGEWDDWYVHHPTVIFDNGIYKMWYSGNDGSHSRIGYSTSSDGILWDRHPGNFVLDVGDTGEWDETGINEPMVTIDRNLYTMWYTGWNPDYNVRIGYATSCDGIIWIKSDANPIFDTKPGTWYSEYVCSASVVRMDNLLKMWYNGWDGSTYRTGLATLTATATATVSFYDGDPDSVGTQIGQDNIVVWGGSPAQASIDWTPTTAGTHDIYVRIENVNPGDADESNNVASKSITVGAPGLSAMDLKKDAICDLEAAKTGDKKVDKKIDKIIGHIENSFEDKLWIDDNHLNPDYKPRGWWRCKHKRYGETVFDEEKKAVEIMMWTSWWYNWIIPKLEKTIAWMKEKGWDTTRLESKLLAMQTALSAFEEVIDKLVEADRILAEIAIDEAPDGPMKNKAQQEFEKALDDIEAGRPVWAIEHFKRAWKYAQDAMDRGEQTPIFPLIPKIYEPRFLLHFIEGSPMGEVI